MVQLLPYPVDPSSHRVCLDIMGWINRFHLLTVKVTRLQTEYHVGEREIVVAIFGKLYQPLTIAFFPLFLRLNSFIIFLLKHLRPYRKV